MTVTTIAVLVNVMLTEDGDYNSSLGKCYVKWWDDGGYNSSVSKCSVNWRWWLQ
jgi:hypothetical protein